MKAHSVTRGGKSGLIEASPEAIKSRVDPCRGKEGLEWPGQLVGQFRMKLSGRIADTIIVRH
jgi:hypothetical protein